MVILPHSWQSQSLHADQGSSDYGWALRQPPGSPDASQSLHADQGSSDLDDEPEGEGADRVSIPP